MEINMKNITKVGLSALAGSLAFTSAQAGEVSISGSMIASYTKKGGYNTTGNPLGMNKELTITGSGELDNGVSVAYKQTVTNAMAYNDSELVFTGVPMTGGATVALTSTGSPLDAIDDKTPIAFEEANAAVGSIDDVAGVNGTYGIRYTLADVMGSGVKLDAMYVPKVGSGDASAEKGSSGSTVDGNEDGYDIVLSGAVPGVDGLTFNAGYSEMNVSSKESAASNGNDKHEGTINLNYAFGAVKVGGQRSWVTTGGTSEVLYETDYLGISYAISDNLSVSYNEIESLKDTKAQAGNVTQDMESISLSYTSGGMTIGILDSDADNASYTSGRTQSARAIQMTIAF
jgi:outer membrane protein OmpU